MGAFTRAILRGAALPTLVVGILVTVVAWLAAGSAAGIGALLGTVVVVAFFMAGQLVLGWVLANNPQLGLTVAMTLYLLKIGVLLALLMALQGVTAFDTKVFALTVLVCTLVWTIAEVWVFSRTKMLVVDPDNVPEAVRHEADSRR